MQQGAKRAATPARKEAIKEALKSKFISLIVRVERLRIYEGVARGRVVIKVVPWPTLEATLISP